MSCWVEHEQRRTLTTGSFRGRWRTARQGRSPTDRLSWGDARNGVLSALSGSARLPCGSAVRESHRRRSMRLPGQSTQTGSIRLIATETQRSPLRSPALRGGVSQSFDTLSELEAARVNSNFAVDNAVSGSANRHNSTAPDLARHRQPEHQSIPALGGGGTSGEDGTPGWSAELNIEYRDPDAGTDPQFGIIIETGSERALEFEHLDEDDHTYLRGLIAGTLIRIGTHHNNLFTVDQCDAYRRDAKPRAGRRSRVPTRSSPIRMITAYGSPRRAPVRTGPMALELRPQARSSRFRRRSHPTSRSLSRPLGKTLW